MADFLTKNRLVTAKVETTAGTDATPTPAADAVLVEEPRGSPNMELERTDEVTGSLDGTQSIVGGGYYERSHRVLMKGSGTPGTEPEFTPYLQAASLGLTTLAANSSGTAQAGAASTITLAVGAPATSLVGFVIKTLTGTGANQERVITAYNTGTKVATIYPNWTTPPDATTTYQVHAGNLFIPVSTSLKTITDYLYDLNAAGGNARLRKLLGAAANLQIAIQTRQVGRMTFDMRGKLSSPSEIANPTGAVFDGTRPRPLRDADAWLDSVQVCFRAFSLNFGNQIVQGDCPGEEFGYDPARVVDRRPTGRINPQMKTLAERNAFADLIAGNTKKLWMSWGETAGNRISMFFPSIGYTGQEEEDLDGILGEGLPFDPTGPDSWIYLLFF